ncbi:precorrin-6A reductase [Butyrivibrio sp. XPD2006]|uniref:precorrin-6A reductase n=1 Tax=Butyrivibrio sp. XPD2006 TaxID=1280668 RepID=UPI00042A671F|nr:precorrin-6A reductase [Butyrivibrio sp. XPD2006]
MRDKILVFGGTTEGRLFASKLEELGIPHVVSVATEYGKTVEEESGEASLLVGRMDSSAIADLLRSGEFAAVVDATHPYAIKASQEIKSACEKESFTYLRLLRKTADSEANEGNVTYVEDVTDAAKELEKRAGNILLLTGSRDLKEITSKISDISRVYVRIIPDVASIEKCHEAGLRGRQIIAMQGPFSAAMNEALIREINASVILTKESGEAGGFSEKLRAADNCNAETIVIRNPEKNDTTQDGLEAGEILEKILAILGKEPLEETSKTITLGGVGPGDERFYTAELSKALKEADIVFGAKTVLERINGISAPQKDWYEGEKILEFLKEHQEYKAPLVVYSGDISLCSGAKKASAIFEEVGYTVKKITGISSVSLFAARIGAALEDVTIISNHGRDCDVCGFVRKNEKVILLVNSAEAALETAKRLPEECRVTFGCELGTDIEKISVYGAEGFLESDVKGKTLMYIENPAAIENKLIPALSDDEIIRGDVPMTKEEVRSLSIRKLGLTKDSILFDVGAGTGSISLEAALTDPGVKVFSIEKSEKAIELLYKNRDKFGLENMEIVEGKAPEALSGLPRPSHVFIGGSSGNLEEIIRSCKRDNGPVRFVVNCVTLETLGKTMEVISAMGAANTEVVQLSAARFKEVGSYHMADGMNPVFVIAFEV